ncbi:hypothetical protein M378DRAFT_73055 [Amanita muscaria Koide BX008]|uniref:Zn(2)-C6 fungal-type domain-containing protein n=1 Tax=Amanita muscaria (strain Koide BX008) TaxID=946122 RepID=A0A0C2XG52_AMAMK|nr:hypothetical protein M378DRAFT_73055 [Amanita muscaria Koide BX008]
MPFSLDDSHKVWWCTYIIHLITEVWYPGCDACRARKVRCVRESPDDQKQTCKHCIALGIPCTYEYQPKKRGPPNLYLRRLQEAAAAGVTVQEDDDHETNAKPATQESTIPHVSTTTPPEDTPFLGPLSSLPPATSVPAPPQLSTSTDTYQSHHPTESSITSAYKCPSDSTNGILPFIAFIILHLTVPFNALDYSWAYKEQDFLPPHPPNVIPPLSYYCRPHRLEDIAPRDTILLIIALFFDFVYPVTPCIHKPSFMTHLHARREERDPLFFSLVMSTVASTLVQMPRSYLPMERSVVRKLAQTCYEASRHVSVATYDPPSSTHVVLRYFDCIYHLCQGHEATQHAAFGEAVHIAITLHLHEEASYEGLDPIESEVRRRIFWILFQADKSMSIILGKPIALRDEDCTVHFPRELDDEYITPSAYLSQPRGQTAIISGLNYCSRIFSLLSEILVRIRMDKRSPPLGHFATARLEEVQTLHHRILSVLSHAPEPLKLKLSHQEYRGSGFCQAAIDEVKDFFDNPNASRANALNPFLVMQANLYVTQQLVRFVIEQYRDELIASIHGDVDEKRVGKDRESVASDLLNILHSIPIQSIATNGPSLVHKVRFVASTLLDTLQKAETEPISAARAHAYLWDFLSILSEIEKNYL